MNNAELIDLFRDVERSNHPVCNGCPMKYTCDKNQITRCLFGTAADALEVDDKRIAELEDELKNLENAYIAELTQAHINVQRSAKIYREWYEAVGRKKECRKNDSE